MEGALLSPLGGEANGRPFHFYNQSSTIHRLSNGLIRKRTPLLDSGSFEYAEAREKLLREAKILQRLTRYRYFPRIIAVDEKDGSIYLSDCGEVLQHENTPCDWKEQMKEILSILDNVQVFHNDWLGLGWPSSPNLCVKDGVLCLIDFTWVKETLF
ncbi:hypothetical protein GUITHDRAFT_115920 [Guillardia theta CCMP2712]|uniref:Protein kinase domain-containing protein n=1 Tax=Guillardia theta (strain CCMP2712) TaxID=905079 RepID=L1IPY3_GUITC|nr:hypothetical protein GUITHDRAFT_115920 [Guillardia theta CCMP2712]EKX37949.1 hypothetical protein GUITHDRAFT_115920 [Guillardia theta CCMP2712]|eukprot:XP_005824929.1 hypothetical protein GUITHDRAFT_115920 [Guillardia theta CCMP2712]